MATFQDLTGQRFERLTVLSLAPFNGKRTRWNVRCDCGTEKAVAADRLKSGSTKSCGCLHRENAGRMNFIHGHASNLRGRNPAFDSWQNMVRRCEDPRSNRYQSHGARGIKVCERWRNDFSVFLVDMGPRPSLNHSIDRIGNDGNYEPGNCRWATNKEQARNRRSNRPVSANGVSRLITDWALFTGISLSTIYRRVANGWSEERAVSEPPDASKQHRLFRSSLTSRGILA